MLFIYRPLGPAGPRTGLGAAFFLAAAAVNVVARPVEALALAGDGPPLLPPVAANAPPVAAKTRAIIAIKVLGVK
jgi:hypothetical protein